MKLRYKLIPVIALMLAFSAVVVLPRIIEAKRAKVLPNSEPTVAQPIQAPQARQNVVVGASVRNDTSIPLREMKQLPIEFKGEKEGPKNPKVRHTHKDAADPVIQTSITGTDVATANIPAPLTTFEGIGFPGVACNCAPPDTNGEVGPNHYVQIVNEGFQVFNKSGTSVLGPSGIQTLWSNFGGVCQNSGFGDPVVLYDQIADRWVITQFAGVSVPTDECIAVSTSGDPTGSWHRYDFHLGSNFFDYPHLGVWPDGYYMSMNVFNSSGTAFLGPQAFVFDRSKMLAGLPATFQTPGITGGSAEETFLPVDLDGSTLPPAGAPATFVEWPSGGTFKVFHFDVDWTTPANTTFTLFSSPASAGFTTLCAITRSCVPQSGTTSRLDAIADRLMFRLAYRNFGTHESVVGNFTVDANAVAGIRWFEMRNVTNGPVTVFQQSTYQPDTTWRWMGSAAMDKDGNLAIGYSASSASIFPQMRYAGRLVGDPLNTLGQGEATLFSGTGSQSGTGSRWGDYSSLTVDPSDDCTFWFTSEYYTTTTSFNWKTRIGSFRFPTCGSSPSPTPTPSPTPSPSPSPSPTPTPTPTPSVPNAPSNLVANAISRNQINLSWSDNSNNETDFLIERCTGNGCSNFVQIATVSMNTTSFPNGGLTPNTRYRYRVRAVNGSGTSAYSNIAQDKTPR